MRFKVKIFIKTSKGIAIKNGAYAAIVEYETKKGPVTREITGKENETTYYRMTLLAIVKSLKILKAPCDVVIYTDCAFVKNMVENGNPEKWKRSEWMKPSGEHIANKELWQEFAEESEEHNIEMRFSKHNKYIEVLEERLNEYRL